MAGRGGDKQASKQASMGKREGALKEVLVWSCIPNCNQSNVLVNLNKLLRESLLAWYRIAAGEIVVLNVACILLMPGPIFLQ